MNRIHVAIVAGLLSAALTARAGAATYTWNSTSGSQTNWLIGADWVGGSGPSLSTDSVLFQGNVYNAGVTAGTNEVIIPGSALTLSNFGLDTSVGFTFVSTNAITLSGFTRSTASAGQQYFYALNGTNFILNTANAVFNIGGSGSVVLNSAIGQGAPGDNFTKTGAGALSLTGGPSAQWSGATYVLAGTLNGSGGVTFNSNSAIYLGDTSGAYQANLYINDGGALGVCTVPTIYVQSGSVGSALLGQNVGSGDARINSAITLSKDLEVVSAGAGGSFWLTGAITGTGNLIFLGNLGQVGSADSTYLTGGVANTFNGTTTVYGGTLVLNKSNGADALGGNLVIGNGYQNATVAEGAVGVGAGVSGELPATASVTVNGAPQYSLIASIWSLGSGTSSSGAGFPANETIQNLTLNGGQVVLKGTNYIGNGLTAQMTSNYFNNGTLNIQGDFTYNGGAIASLPAASASTTALQSSFSWIGLGNATNNTGGRILVTSGTSTLTGQAVIDFLGSQNHEINIAAGSSMTNNPLGYGQWIEGSGGITKTGGGTLYLLGTSGNYAYTGGFTIGQGTVVVKDSANLLGGLNNSAVTIAGGTLNVGGAGGAASIHWTTPLTISTTTGTATSTIAIAQAGSLYEDGGLTVNANVTNFTIDLSQYIGGNNTGLYLAVGNSNDAPLTFNGNTAVMKIIPAAAGPALSFITIGYMAGTNGFTIDGGGGATVVFTTTNNTAPGSPGAIIPQSYSGTITAQNGAVILLANPTAAGGAAADGELGTTNTLLIMNGATLGNPGSASSTYSIYRPILVGANGATIGDRTTFANSNQFFGGGPLTFACSSFNNISLLTGLQPNFTGTVYFNGSNAAWQTAPATLGASTGFPNAAGLVIGASNALSVTGNGDFKGVPITVNGQLTYGAAGVSTNTVTVNSGGEVIYSQAISTPSDGVPTINAGGILDGTAAVLSGFNAGGGGNVVLNTGAVIADANAYNNNTNLLTGLGTTPNYILGIGGSTVYQVTVGTGTPWEGIQNDRTARVMAGAIALNSAVTLTGYGPQAPLVLNVTSITSSGGPYTVNVYGYVQLISTVATSTTYAGVNLWDVQSGGVLFLGNSTNSTAAGMGQRPAQVESGGRIVAIRPTSVDGNLTLEAGSVFEVGTNNSGLSGGGTITHGSGNLTVQLDNVAALTGTQTGFVFSTNDTFFSNGDVLRLAAPSSSNEVTYIHNVNPAVTFVIVNTDRVFTATGNFLLNGGIITNDSNNRAVAPYYASPNTYSVVIGTNGATFAAATGTALGVMAPLALPTVGGSTPVPFTLYVGNSNTIDGLARAGTVIFANTNAINTSNVANGVTNALSPLTIDLQAGAMAAGSYGAYTPSQTNYNMFFWDVNVILRNNTVWNIASYNGTNGIQVDTNRTLTVNLGDSATINTFGATASNAADLTYAYTNQLNVAGTLTINSTGSGCYFVVGASTGYFSNANFTGTLILNQIGNGDAAQFYSGSTNISPLGTATIVLNSNNYSTSGGVTTATFRADLQGSTMEVFGNNLVVLGTGSAIKVQDRSSSLNQIIGLGSLTFGPNAVLSVYNANGYGVSFGQVNLNGNASITNYGTPVAIGALNDGGAPATLTMNGNTNLTLGAAAAGWGANSTLLVVSGTAVVNAAGALGSGTLTINNGAANLTAAGAASGGAVNLNYGGGLYVNAANALNGSTLTVSSSLATFQLNAAQSAMAGLKATAAGTYVDLNNNAVTAGNVAVLAGAEINANGLASLTVNTNLSGTGQITGTVSLANLAGGGVTLTPGSSSAAGNPGTLYVENLTFAGSGAGQDTYQIDLGSHTYAGSGLGTNAVNALDDLVWVNGNLNLANGGLLVVNSNSADPFAGAGTYYLFRYTGTLTTNNGSILTVTMPTGFSGTVTYDAVNGFVELTANNASGNTSTLALNTNSLLLRSMQGGSATVAATLSETSGSAAATFIATNTANGTVSPTSGTLVASSSTQLTLGWASYAGTGPQSATITATNTANSGDAFNTSGNTISLTGAVVTNRVISAPTVSLGRVMVGQTATSTGALSFNFTSTANDDNYFTRVTIGAGSATDGQATVAGGSSLTFNGTNTSLNRSISLTSSYGSTGVQSGTVSMSVSGEGLTGETDAAAVGYTVTAVQNRVVLATLTTQVYSNMLYGAAVSTGLTLTSTSNDDNTYTRVTVANGADGDNNFTVSGGANPTFNGTNYTDSRTLSGSLTNYGTINGSFNLTTGGEGLTGESPVPVTVSYTAYNVGLAVAGSGGRNAFGTALTGQGVGGSYAGLAAKTTHTATNGSLGTTAQLLAGVSSSGLNVVSMAWRNRYDGTVAGVAGSQIPESTLLESDVLQLTGLGLTGATPLPSGLVETDPFVLQMSYQAGSGPHWIDYLNLGSDNALGGIGAAHDYWAAAVTANFTNGVIGSLGSAYEGNNRSTDTWAAFAAANGITSGNLDLWVGAEGYSNGQAWAVLDYDAQFAVVPMPIALWSGLATLGGLAVARFIRRRKQSGEF